MTNPSETAAGAWARWLPHALGVWRLEIRKCLVGRRLIGLYVLGVIPVALMALAAALMVFSGQTGSLADTHEAFAAIFQGFFIRCAIFFGAAALFTNLFRGELVDRTLHYYFLTPAPRSAVAAGKFAAGWASASLLLGASTATCFVLAYLPLGRGVWTRYLLDGPGLGHLAGYLGVVALACLGYGAVFTLLGTLFRVPVLPALTLFAWESVNFLLPGALQKISVIHYLQSLTPVRPSQGTWAVLADATPLGWCLAGLVAMTAAALAVAAWRLRRMDVTYGDG